MSKAKVITIVGARPQFIKFAAVYQEMSKRSSIREIVIHTGQHFDKDMSDAFFRELGIPRPDYSLNINRLNHGAMIGRMLEEIEDILIKEKPRLVLVYGDTNSTLAGALAAKKLYIKIAHIEAGLRSFNMQMPEEVNRTLTDRISDFLFCPTKRAVFNLKAEGINKGVYLVGDVMCDNLRYYLPKAKKISRVLLRLRVRPKSYYLLTIHRAENTTSKKRLKRVLTCIDHFDLPVVFPMHPRTRKFLGNSFVSKKGLIVTSPVSYLDMLILEKNAKAILTDSGGVQKEAYLLNVPCLTLRHETEWTETLQHGCNRIVDIDKEDLVHAFYKLDKSEAKFNSNVFGNGHAAKKIVKILLGSI